jgi:hypothetical protein
MRPPQRDVDSRQGIRHEFAADAPHVPGALCLAVCARFKPSRMNESQGPNPDRIVPWYGDL